MTGQRLLTTLLLLVAATATFSSTKTRTLVFVELNCENLFDCVHDEGKDDTEFTPQGSHHWSRSRYWRKLNAIGQEILSCSDALPDLVALVEVENDSVLRDLTRRSLLRGAGYEYIMTDSPDVRGLDVALLYHPHRFRPLCYDYIPVRPIEGMRPTRDILHVVGETIGGDTLHVFVCHAPSRYGGELETRPYRQRASDALIEALPKEGGELVIVAGDFNDYYDSPSLCQLTNAGLVNISASAKGRHGRAKGSYRYHGDWHSLDHILLSPALVGRLDSVYINDPEFLLEQDKRYGGWKPRRTFLGPRYLKGTSDHLPLVTIIRGE